MICVELDRLAGSDPTRTLLSILLQDRQLLSPSSIRHQLQRATSPADLVDCLEHWQPCGNKHREQCAGRWMCSIVLTSWSLLYTKRRWEKWYLSARGHSQHCRQQLQHCRHHLQPLEANNAPDRLTGGQQSVLRQQRRQAALVRGCHASDSLLLKQGKRPVLCAHMPVKAWHHQCCSSGAPTFV